MNKNNADEQSALTTTNNKKPLKIPYKEWWFWVIVAVCIGVIAIIVSIVSSLIKNNGNNGTIDNSEQEYTIFGTFDDIADNIDQQPASLEEVDINGMTVEEACKAVRKKGWRVDEVKENGTYKAGDCSSNGSAYVVKAYYYDYNRTVEIYFNKK